ncbi:hypothetical protein AMAG_16310 [Allomyces macrogynus ATCC 38327]|uniref:Uncharacterized protein n=1 Tax=Allomyces macrogynus (strain ATCC 38327) TaxID=578462 RepID=A0A0L0TAY6_ALLM3|nr:hypothetical protein AMAG_16310 [Allomyces macrogynus ATCC 38327]|eukprot:KNE71881.1 hypothetical protein AMAG_16310 [Allomyces macrogynus ATCC 38327]
MESLVDEDAALRAQLQELVADEITFKTQEAVLMADAARSEVDLRRKLREEHDKLIRMRDELAAEAVSLQAELESVKARCEKTLRDRTNKRNDLDRDGEKRKKYEARTHRLQRQIAEMRGTAPSSSDTPKRNRTPSPPAVPKTKRAKSVRSSVVR